MYISDFSYLKKNNRILPFGNLFMERLSVLSSFIERSCDTSVYASLIREHDNKLFFSYQSYFISVDSAYYSPYILLF